MDRGYSASKVSLVVSASLAVSVALQPVVGFLSDRFDNPVVEQMATVSRFPYGRIRVYGTLGYAVGTQISGILYRYVSPGAMYQMCGIGMVVCMAGILGTQDVRQKGEEEGKPSKKGHLSPFHVSGTGHEHRYGGHGDFCGNSDGVPHRYVFRQGYGLYEK